MPPSQGFKINILFVNEGFTYLNAHRGHLCNLENPRENKYRAMLIIFKLKSAKPLKVCKILGMHSHNIVRISRTICFIFHVYPRNMWYYV